MKLVSADIKNFRLLKNIHLDFSRDPEKPLTVIRAANETGKTTCLTALTWCLYGSAKALPNKGDYVLYPADNIEYSAEKVNISVVIEFELDQVVSSSGDKFVEKREKYRLIRTCVEAPPVAGVAKRLSENSELWLVTPSGTQRVLDSEVKSVIDRALPESLKDVYFTDGDRAMLFIESGVQQGIKRKRVNDAIQSLLGLNILDVTREHLAAVTKIFGKGIDNKDYAKEYERLSDRISSYKEDIEEGEAKIAELIEDIGNVEEQIAIKQKEIEEELKKGDREELVLKMRKLEADKNRGKNSIEIQLSSLSSLVSDELVSKAFLSDHLEASKSLLRSLSDSKQLPKVNIPILEELLQRDSCFCGSDLSSATVEGEHRKSLIAAVIKDSYESDRAQEVATSLYYRIRSIATEGVGQDWLRRYEEGFTLYQNTLKNYDLINAEIEDISSQIDGLKDNALQEKREQARVLDNSRHMFTTNLGAAQSELRNNKEKLDDANDEIQKVRNKLDKNDKVGNNLDVANIVRFVFEEVVNLLKTTELRKVSDEMNRIFMDMIGGDISDKHLGSITKAELTENYDIVVYGQGGHVINPDQDLNGASRRAITLAFILALTKVSRVEAPNIIDTPLGMMSGYVKQSVLLRTIEEGSQAILFLTHDEIRGVEEIVDKYAGVVYTITNPRHYPKMLVNEPDSIEGGIIRCECSHREDCVLCARKSVKVI